MQAVQKSEAKEKDKPEPKATAPAVIRPSDVWIHEQENTVWGGKVAKGSKPEDFDMNASTTMMLGEMKQFDTIWLAPLDNSWAAEYICLRPGQGQALLKLMRAVQVPALAGLLGPKPLPEGWEIVPAERGEGQGFMHRRKSDGMRIGNSGGVAFDNWQLAYEELLKRPIFAGEKTTRYYPG